MRGTWHVACACTVHVIQAVGGAHLPPAAQKSAILQQGRYGGSVLLGLRRYDDVLVSVQLAANQVLSFMVRSIDKAHDPEHMTGHAFWPLVALS